MADDQRTDRQYDPEERKQELISRFASLGPDEARRQVAILPYYHQVENEITKPNQGVFVTRYFLTRWCPTLGPEASNIIIALRLLADRDGQTFASVETIALYARISPRALKRWLSENEDAVADRSSDWRVQWKLLHDYFLRSKSARYLIRKEGSLSRAKRTTNLYQVAMDDPVHPDDEGVLFVKIAERIVQSEADDRRRNSQENNGVSYKGPVGPHRKKVVLPDPGSVDNSAYKGPVGPHEVGPGGPSLSFSYRSNVTNVMGKKSQEGIRRPSLSSSERESRDAMALQIGDQLKTMTGRWDGEDHKSAGFHRRIALLMPEHLIQEALTATRDAVDDQRSGRKDLRDGPDAYFAGAVRKIAEREGLDLGVNWKTDQVSTDRTKPLEGYGDATGGRT